MEPLTQVHKYTSTQVHKYTSTQVHKYTSTQVILIFFSMLFSGTLFGQGNLSFASSGVDPLTGTSFVTVNWNNNLINPSKGVNITLFIEGTSICLDQANSIVHSDFNNNVTYNSNSVVIQKLGFSSPFNLQTDYEPLLTLYFRAAPGSTVGLVFNIATVLNNSSPAVSFSINTPSKFDLVMPNPINISGIVRKFPGASAQCWPVGANTGITNVNMRVESTGTTCFPAYDAYNNYTGFPSNPFNFISLDGQYTVDVPSHYIYKITPSKSSSCGCGLDAYDLNMARTLFDGLYDGTLDPTTIDISLAQWMALDFTGDGYVSNFDIIAMQLCSLGTYNPPAGWSAWRFMPITQYIDNNPPKYFPLTYIPSFITTPRVTQQLIFQDFFGFKVGDFDGSCTDCNDPLMPDKDPAERSISKHIAYHIEKTKMVKGEEQYWYITLDEDVDGLAIVQLEFNLDGKVFEVLDVKAEDVSAALFQTNLSVLNGNTPLKINWISERKNGESLQKGQYLARVHVKALQNETEMASVFKAVNSNTINCYYQNGKASAILSEVNIANTNQLTLGLLGKNPINDVISGVITGCDRVEINIQLLNLQGQVIRQLSIDPKSAQETFEINDLNHLSSGIYILNATSSTGSASTRIVKQ